VAERKNTPSVEERKGKEKEKDFFLFLRLFDIYLLILGPPWWYDGAVVINGYMNVDVPGMLSVQSPMVSVWSILLYARHLSNSH
jgi:hypothetical protein